MLVADVCNTWILFDRKKKDLALCHIKILKVTERIDIKVVKRFAVFCVDKLIIVHVQMPAQGC